MDLASCQCLKSHSTPDIVRKSGPRGQPFAANARWNLENLVRVRVRVRVRVSKG